MNRFAYAAATLATLALVGVGFAMHRPEATFNLQATSATGDAYIIDHGLTLSDCVSEWGWFPADVPLACNLEGITK